MENLYLVWFLPSPSIRAHPSIHPLLYPTFSTHLSVLLCAEEEQV